MFCRRLDFFVVRSLQIRDSFSTFIPASTRLFSVSQTRRRVFRPSVGQTAVVNYLKTHNVMVSARPGAGKTATAEAVVQANPYTPITVITYSKRLQVDTKKRLRRYPLVDVFTFHGLASRFFGSLIHNDTLLANIRRSAIPPTWIDIPRYEIVILDELQDLTEDLYWLTCAFITFLTRVSGRAPQLLVLGDPRQAIYDFRGADQRYLELSSDTLSAVSPYEWRSAQLSQSFRLSCETANFVNNAFLGGEPYIQGSHTGPKPLYIHGDLYRTAEILEYIYPLIRKYGHKNTAILAPSLRTNGIVKRIINTLWEQYKIPAAHAISDDLMGLDDDVTRGKIIPSTYHQFKGSERDLVIVLGADNSYFRLMARALRNDRCPNATFVALTRARKQLVVLHSHEDPQMPFVDWAAIESGADVINLEDEPLKAQNKPGCPPQLGLHLPRIVPATDAARHVREEALDSIVRPLDIRKVQPALPPLHCIDAPDKVRTDAVKNHWEPVSDLNGLTVTLDFEYWLTGKVVAFMNDKQMERLPEKKSLEDDTYRAIWLSKEATHYDAITSGFRSRWHQMQYNGHKFDWMVPHLTVSTERLSKQFSEYNRSELARDLAMEVSLKLDLSIDSEKTVLTGRADMIHSRNQGRDVTTIWEVKFVTAFSHEHVVQTVIYGYLWAMNHQNEPFPRLVLYNVKNDEKWEIRTTLDQAKQVIVEVLRTKFTSNGQIPTDVFLKGCANVREEVAQLWTEGEHVG
ncbi:P-loop containing nucleoside triphosphate hydrolase protein [Desarmillaria tabescens]|uniref:P-loop containing nucleoside triphosphate hydrolase protein n=1 Tax=Armillaria tabescens TaxID=1929756 RepID=A0AA39N8T1_ARMTA|nr:P-loop containing nucleoside triphosphate hydrolase protein [Desarmillaria tabescens]KAK0461118.1 P-loop containing nucleoside triphosphate hydrolase protein [Desarmillaria tabescens]